MLPATIYRGVWRNVASLGFHRRAFRARAGKVWTSAASSADMKGGKRKEKPQRNQRKGGSHTTSYVQVLGNGTDTGDTCPSVLLFFDQYRYIFNVGEGFQRYCFQHKIKLGKVTDLFFTRMSTEACGGVPGLILTLTDHGIGGLCLGTSGLNLHGPLHVRTFLDAVETFVALQQTDVVASSFGANSGSQPGQFLESLVKNEQVTIRPLVLMPEGSAGMVDQEELDAEQAETERAKKSRVERSSKNSTACVPGGVPAACYICELSEAAGKFHPERAKALGLQPGPIYAKIQKGASVETPTGETVHPHQVMDPPIPGPVVLIVECPDEAYLNPLLEAPGFNEWLSVERTDGENVLVVHMGSARVVASEAYMGWVERFPTGTNHMFVNLEACESSAILRKAAVVQTKLNCVDDRFFPLPATVDVLTPMSNRACWEKDGFVMGKDLMKYWLKPSGRLGPDATKILEPFSVEKVVDDFQAEHVEAREALRRYKDSMEAKSQEPPSSSPQIAADELELTFLGTGSAVPSKYRNVTCIYLDFFKKGSMFLDCGEGSLGQLVRRFGVEGANDALRKLRCVWISHIHADHHAGLSRLLAARQKLVGPDGPKVLIIGPPGFRKTVLSYAKLDQFQYHYLITNSVASMGRSGEPLKYNSPKVGEKRPGPPKAVLEMFDEVKRELGLKEIDSFLVKHCSNAFGVSIESNNWKVVFSGDSMPCESLVKAAKDATLLIHEATFEEEMADEAKKKKHSTTKDALSIAEQAGAYRTILTHFSQRYPKVPVLPEAEKRASIGVAFDLMRVNLSHLEALPKTVDPCMFLFDEEQKEAEDGAEDDFVIPDLKHVE
ncbi:hypothetical protein BSKO_08689 [Bryopsis sp. KO-2023]|nr:hypothetical protein BSKO_08689 [Bryopsis sp. KO-2023]